MKQACKVKLHFDCKTHELTMTNVLNLQRLLDAQSQHFVNTHPRSMAMAQSAQTHYALGMPLHWMCDWPTPGQLFIEHAQGVHLRCVDGLTYTDFCLGDSAAMFGHSPPVLAQALAEQAQNGLSTMLPSHLTVAVGAALTRVFGLPQWQMALSASDANRFLLRWARAVTQRPVVLVFDGCYHGAVDDTLVDMDLQSGHSVRRPSVLGQVHQPEIHTRVIPFNDLDALEAALADHQVAALLAEPALTNFGLVPPIPGYWSAAQALCQRHGTLWICDETHTLSCGQGGFARQQGLEPDALVVGKAVAGGLPCAVYGVSTQMAQAMRKAKRLAPEGHSGIGTTLSGNALTMAVLHASLLHLHTIAHHAHMQTMASRLTQGMQDCLNRHRQPWTVTRLGARLELQFMPKTPLTAAEVRCAHTPTHRTLLQSLQLFMINRGLVLTPFHAMCLCSPDTQNHDVDVFLTAFEDWLHAIDPTHEQSCR